MPITHKPELDKLRQWVASIEASAHLSPRDKARLLSLMEGIVSARAEHWRSQAAKHDDKSGVE